MKKIIIPVLLLAGLLIYIFSSQPEEELAQEKNTLRRVQTETVSQLQSQSEEEIFAYGQVVSVTSVDVVPEINGVVTRVNKRLGSVVRPGDVILQLQNNTQSQQVAQARASLTQARAQLAKVSKDADESTLAQATSGVVAAKNALAQAEQGTLSSLDSLYTGLQNLLTGSLDRNFFTNTNTDFPDIRFDIDVESDEIALGQKRAQVRKNLELDRSYADVDKAITQFADRIADISDLNKSVLAEINKLQAGGALSQKTIDGQKSEIALIQDQLASFSAQAKTLNTSLSDRRQAVVSAELQIADIKDGADREDILSAQASVAQAEASLLSAEIAFGKTQIKSPVFGTISAIETRIGQLVGPGSSVFSVANENALRIDTSVTSAEARKLSVGDEVLVDEEYKATLSVISSSVDDTTGRVKVQVLLDDQEVTLTSGSGVGLVFNLSDTNRNISERSLSVPISSVFVRGDKAFVYVLQDNKAVPTEITTDDLFGENIEVVSGLKGSDVVILSARGLKDNESVEVITN